jgi:hypothetical protein
MRFINYLEEGVFKLRPEHAVKHANRVKREKSLKPRGTAPPKAASWMKILFDKST